MNGELTLGISYFGKLPSHGDFLKAPGNNHQLIAMLDEWVGQALTRLSEDVAWKQRYDGSHPVNFAMLGSRRRTAIAGHLFPSTDASGRRYPFITAVSMEVPQPLAFLSRSPLAFSRVWARLERESGTMHGQDDPLPTLQALTENRANVNVIYEALNPAFQDFLEMQTLGSFEALLDTAENPVSVRRILLSLGVLLQPVMGAGSSGMGKGLILPLPSDPLYRNLVSTFWLDLVAGFLGRADFELLILMRRDGPAMLAIGFNGLQERNLQAMFDPAVAESDYVHIHDPDWVEDHVDSDPGLAKLATYADEPGLSLRTARTTFRETFLGA